MIFLFPVRFTNRTNVRILSLRSELLWGVLDTNLNPNVTFFLLM
nr:MAG TPA: hypothetical protein [Caudoviricetes sp.]